MATLRKTFKQAGVTDLLITSPPGYLLAKGEHRIDVQEFLERAEQGRDAARHGRTEEACTQFEEALSIWRGSALDEPSGSRLEAETTRLEQMRLALVEERAGLMLQLGRHRALTGELTELVARHPCANSAANTSCWRCTGPGSAPRPWRCSCTAAGYSPSSSGSNRVPDCVSCTN